MSVFNFFLLPQCGTGYLGSFSFPQKLYNQFVNIHKLLASKWGWKIISPLGAHYRSIKRRKVKTSPCSASVLLHEARGTGALDPLTLPSWGDQNVAPTAVVQGNEAGDQVLTQPH